MGIWFDGDIHRDIITGDGYRRIATVRIDVKPDRSAIEKCLSKSQIVYCKTDFLYDLFDGIRHSDNTYTLISHNSDHPIDDRRMAAKPECVKTWFATNVATRRVNLIPIPFGIQRSSCVGFCGNVDLVAKAAATPIRKDALCYWNCNPNTNTAKRFPVEAMARLSDFVTYDKHNNVSENAFYQYLTKMRRHHFVLSPEGNGIECHRTWEALYCGVIPIVHRSYQMRCVGADLPMVMVNDFQYVTRHFLTATLEAMQSMTWDYTRAKIGYWINLIGDTHANSLDHRAQRA